MVGLRPCGCWQELMGLRQIISEFDDTGVERLASTEGRLSQVVADYRFFCCDPLRAHGTSTCRLHDQVVACGGAQFPGMRACPDNQPLAVQETISEEIVRSSLTSVQVGGGAAGSRSKGFQLSDSYLQRVDTLVRWPGIWSRPLAKRFCSLGG